MTKRKELKLLAAPNKILTVCLLDDDSSVLKATGRLLAAAGWNVKSFADPIAFLDYARVHRPPVAIIDVWLPVMNGLEVQTQLRNFSPSTRVIIMTSQDDPQTRSKAMDTGASAFFLKPVDDDEFLTGVESAFSGESD